MWVTETLLQLCKCWCFLTKLLQSWEIVITSDFDPADIKERFTSYVLLLIVCLRNMEQFAWNPGSYLFFLKLQINRFWIFLNSLYFKSNKYAGEYSDKSAEQLHSCCFGFFWPTATPWGVSSPPNLSEYDSWVRDESWAFLYDSPLKTFSSSCQSQSQAHSRWQTWTVSWNQNTDVQIQAELQPSVAEAVNKSV